jgi:hypothetical protein
MFEHVFDIVSQHPPSDNRQVASRAAGKHGVERTRVWYIARLLRAAKPVFVAVDQHISISVKEGRLLMRSSRSTGGPQCPGPDVGDGPGEAAGSYKFASWCSFL